MKTGAKPRIALWFRYGPAEHSELFHAMPEIVEELARTCEVHYFGLRSDKPVPELIVRNAVVHHLPFRVRRTSGRDKTFKTLLWLLCFPWMGLYCRARDVRAVYIDETVPLTAGLARLFFGPRVATTIADFFLEVYFRKSSPWAPLVRWVQALDYRSWRKLPLIFTRVVFTKAFLVEKGCRPEAIVPVYDPCDFKLYHPLADKAGARKALGFSGDEIVLVHHGILHPNKGNDRIIRALAELLPAHPRLRYLLIGDGPDMKNLRQLVEDLRLQDKVILTGWLPALADVNRALNAGDIGLVMRIGQSSDNFHVTGALVHSMACGLPVLAARLGGISEVVAEDREGRLFDPNDMEEFKAALLDLAADPAKRARLGQAAHARAVELFDMRRVTMDTVNPLLRLVEEPSCRR